MRRVVQNQMECPDRPYEGAMDGISTMHLIKFSVIVPTWNEEKALPICLGRIAYHASVAEIIVADNSSVDNTTQLQLIGAADSQLGDGRQRVATLALR
jgi:hypothetical protein